MKLNLFCTYLLPSPNSFQAPWRYNFKVFMQNFINSVCRQQIRDKNKIQYFMLDRVKVSHIQLLFAFKILTFWKVRGKKGKNLVLAWVIILSLAFPVLISFIFISVTSAWILGDRVNNEECAHETACRPLRRFTINLYIKGFFSANDFPFILYKWHLTENIVSNILIKLIFALTTNSSSKWKIKCLFH